jgi:hypothetical protein
MRPATSNPNDTPPIIQGNGQPVFLAIGFASTASK